MQCCLIYLDMLNMPWTSESSPCMFFSCFNRTSDIVISSSSRVYNFSRFTKLVYAPSSAYIVLMKMKLMITISLGSIVSSDGISRFISLELCRKFETFTNQTSIIMDILANQSLNCKIQKFVKNINVRDASNKIDIIYEYQNVWVNIYIYCVGGSFFPVVNVISRLKPKHFKLPKYNQV